MNPTVLPQKEYHHTAAAVIWATSSSELLWAYATSRNAEKSPVDSIGAKLA